MKRYIIKGTREAMMEMVYNELIGRESIKIIHRIDFMDCDGLEILVNKSIENGFRVICHEYGITIAHEFEEEAE